MLLTFLRHAEAENEVTTDFDRRLTPKGLEQAEKVGKFCVKFGLVPDVILSSPVVRADQTARVVSKRLDGREIVTEHWLACGMSPDVCFLGLGVYAKFDHVMLVGHEPDFSETISSLTGGSIFNIRKASLTGIDLFSRPRAGAGRLEFSLPVRLM